eukprot:4125112-Lingulodinium_polyedra.AAC.1
MRQFLCHGSHVHGHPIGAALEQLKHCGRHPEIEGRIGVARAQLTRLVLYAAQGKPTPGF